MAICRSQSNRCLVLLGLAISISIVSLLVVFSLHDVVNEISDPEFELPPSSMPVGLYSKVGVVSNGGPCAQIGVDVMSNGGNAVDAAIATMICDGALCPQFKGLGGGFLMSIYNATTKKVMSIDARETAPSGATDSMFVKEPKNSVLGGLAVAVPGELKGYSTIYNLYGGHVSWPSLFEPTIQLCEEGMLISNRLELGLKAEEDLIKNDPMLRKAFFDEHTGHVKMAGEMYTLPKLAETMKIIAKEGVDAIYNGSLTERLLEDLKTVNGIITKEDLASYKVEVEESFSVNLKNGHTIHSGPPPSSGIILAYILRVLDGMLPAPNAGLDAHRLVEAFKFGYGERTHLADHKFVNVSQIYDKVKSDSYIDKIRSRIFDNFTSSDPKYYGGDFDMPENHGTANMVVIDSMGNVVISTSTINTYFGSGFMSPSTGLLLNNEMDDFSTPGVVNYYGIPSSPANYIEPGKRPMSSMCPTIITDKKKDFVLAAGAAGGSKITLATAYVTALKLWYNKTLKEVIDKPRIFHQLLPMQVQYEYGTTRDVIQTLKDIGHPVIRLSSTGTSAATAIAKSASGMIEAMPDFRRPGNSSGY
ncbi:scoloptoxin SSD14-like [Metopolophium dirhodum]|uniref:scoloptoxin SSD14-like n=1 Tax=Metopolophium dirhodum TaxID=44670 RepID=UPI00298F6909|nr:scoloptoxin SSD14-like [Metopolophium dirhodum]XP_060862917.1 scoloptoxin SSD14-like [Metopolophium dirhodum]XP_060862918.1 scoloptoxin SSD14-like [Metopolophium dirhodum]